MYKEWIELLASWERKNGTLAGIMPHEYDSFISQVQNLAIRNSPRAALYELEGMRTTTDENPRAEILRRHTRPDND